MSHERIDPVLPSFPDTQPFWGGQGAPSVVVEQPDFPDTRPFWEAQLPLPDDTAQPPPDLAAPVDPAWNASPLRQRLAARYAPQPVSKNYFLRHWRGECSLPQSYWVNSTLLGAFLPALLVGGISVAADQGGSLRTISIIGLSSLVFYLLVWCWASVGTWRSAARRSQEVGIFSWGGITQFVMALGVLGMLSNIHSRIYPQMHEYALILAGKDPIGEVSVSTALSGKWVLVRGTLREGAAQQVHQALAAAPNATMLVLDSNGGRLLEAHEIADDVRARHLNTYVENMCASACTTVFLAGVERAATDNAHIGFHRPSFAGMDSDALAPMTDKMMNDYRNAGLPESFVQHIRRTPSSSIWYPSTGELMEARVLTRVSPGGEATMLTDSMRTPQDLNNALRKQSMLVLLEQQFPGTLADMTAAGWAVRQRGGNDAEMNEAIVKVKMKVYLGPLLHVASAEQLERFERLAITEIIVAQSWGAQQCAQYLAGTLDLNGHISPTLVESERAIYNDILTNPARPALAAPSKLQSQQVMHNLVLRMNPYELAVLRNKAAYSNAPERICSANIAMHQAALSLPQPERTIALQTILLQR